MIKLTISNINETFKDLEKEYAKTSQEALVDSSKELMKELKEQTPVDTGKARDSWVLVNKENNVEIKNTTDYIQYLNAGTSKQAPAHFIETTALKFGKPLGIIAEIKQE
jgi:HK97 gp10 family phage protein